MQVVVTAAGRGKRFSENGYAVPKPAVLLGERPAVTYLMDCFPKEWSQIFVLAEDDRASRLEKIITEKNQRAKVIYTSYSERGPIDTVLHSLPFLKSDDAVLISYCDLALIWNPQQFAGAMQSHDMGVVTYQGFHPTYLGPNSYCHVQVEVDSNQITELQEKKLYTNDIQTEVTSAGFYYFRNKELLEKALSAQLNQGLKHGKEYYISQAIQALLNTDKKYDVENFKVNHVLQMGAPADVERFELWLQSFSKDYFSEALCLNEKKYWREIFAAFKLI